MPKMRGLLHPKPKIDDEETALAQARLAARLADLFGQGAAAPAEDPFAEDASPEVIEAPADAGAGEMDSSAPAGLLPWPGGPRPPILVEGDANLAGVETERGEFELVGVMARSGDHVGDEEWGLLLADVSQPTLDPGPSEGTTTDEAAVGKATGPSGPAPVDPVAVDPVAVDPVAVDPVAVDPVAAVVEAPYTAPSSPSHRGSSHDKPGRSATGRSSATRTTKSKARTAPEPTAFCPYCAVLMHPPPASSRRCARCHQRIIVKRVEKRAVYLTEAAVLVFEAERRRVATSGRLTRERERWLRLAAAAGAPAERQARLTAAPISEEAVDAVRTLYLGTVDRAFTAAKRDHDWETASRIRREHATTLYRIAGSPLPPPADLLALFREGVVAELRGISEISRDAELVSAACCAVCRADDRRIFRISNELRAPRLPHEGCPRGLCRCGWDLAARDRTTIRRYLQHRPRPESRAGSNEPAPST